MRTLKLGHDARLAAPQPFPAAISGPWLDAASTLISFRSFTNHGATDELPGLNAASRLLTSLGNDLALVGLESDSQLAPLLIWDIAHTLPVGGTVTFANDGGRTPYLERTYFRTGFQAETKQAGAITYRKHGELPAELDRGLDRWTFGIPTGPGDATGLNAVVKRILELGCRAYEIILCGRPGPGFKYFDRVRIVGEEFSKPPVRIGLKKNVIAREAKYENLCILHDRVFLPLDFKSAMESYGDLYPMTAFQSVWFDDLYNLVPRRYSDYGKLLNAWCVNTNVAEGQSATIEPFRQDVIGVQDGVTVTYASPLRYDESNYCTGSLYIAKKRVWNLQPQSDDLLWEQYEDVEHGLRLSRCGIPSRINVHSLTQTIFPRLSIIDDNASYESAAGALIKSSPQLQYARIRRKPMMKLSKAQALENAKAFAAKYVSTGSTAAFDQCPIDSSFGTSAWISLVGRLIYQADIEYKSNYIDRFLEDCGSLLFPVKLTHNEKRIIIEFFASECGGGRALLFERNYHLYKLALLRPHGEIFQDAPSDFFIRRSRFQDWSSWFTAVRLGRHNGDVLYHPLGAKGFHRSILNSTPYVDYCE